MMMMMTINIITYDRANQFAG